MTSPLDFQPRNNFKNSWEGRRLPPISLHRPSSSADSAILDSSLTPLGFNDNYFSYSGDEFAPSVPGIHSILAQLDEDKSKKPHVGTKEWINLRRESHKQVERKRREGINSNINILSSMVPGPEKNKGGILNRVIHYIQSLRSKHHQLNEENIHFQSSLNELSHRIQYLEHENNLLRSQLSAKSQHQSPPFGI